MTTSVKRCRQGRLRHVNPKKQAPGRCRPEAQVWVFKAPRVQLATEFDRISELPTSCQQQPNLPSTLGLATPPSQPRAPHQFHSRGSGQARCVTRNDGWLVPVPKNNLVHLSGRRPSVRPRVEDVERSLPWPK